MPELPEVETIRRALLPAQGSRIVGVRQLHPDSVKRRDFPLEELPGAVLCRVTRRGKHLVLHLGAERALLVHLGMSGQFLRCAAGEAVAPHTHFVLDLEDGSQLRYVDPRRFGGIRLVKDPAAFFAGMGSEPLGRRFGPQELQARFQGRRAPVKALLLDQSLVAGVGNIYADEALFDAGIHPARPAGSLSGEEIARLCRSIRRVLRRAIAGRGTTVRDYRDAQGNPGGFQQRLAVYARQGQPCVRCGRPFLES
jgi:formamidopyrimidine-DNA glycosylase